MQEELWGSASSGSCAPREPRLWEEDGVWIAGDSGGKGCSLGGRGALHSAAVARLSQQGEAGRAQSGLLMFPIRFNVAQVAAGLLEGEGRRPKL